MLVTIVAAHPTVTVVRTPDGQAELPTNWFPTAPTIGQQWNISLDHQVTDDEKIDQLNSYLARD